MAKFKMKGFDKLQKELNTMERKAKELEKGVSVSLDELFNPLFMHEHTFFDSFEEFLSDGNFVVETQEDFEAIPEQDLDAHVASKTKFKNWAEMSEQAAGEYAMKQLGF
ncbi:hypothetical protein C3943_22260 [Lysinibacillus sp. B2A1]|nr:hypothetical protein C3943_22260 [Lysinibacillus sp. B2A1]